MTNELIIKIKELRNKTGISIKDCKKTLLKNDLDINKAIIDLKKMGIINANSRSSKSTNCGTININISKNQKKAVILEINCETDFVSKSDDFQNFSKFISSNIIEKEIKVDKKYNINEIPDYIDNERKSLIAKLNENILIKRIKKITTTENYIFSYTYEINKIGKIGAIIIVDKIIPEQEIYKDILLQIIAMKPKYISKLDLNDKTIQDNQFPKEEILLEQKYIKNNNIIIKDIIKEKFNIIDMVRFEIGEDV